jgi:hypothetical protein
MPTRTIPQPQARDTMMSTAQRVLLMTALALYAGLVFVLDLITPVGIEIWVLNLPVRPALAGGVTQWSAVRCRSVPTPSRFPLACC